MVLFDTHARVADRWEVLAGEDEKTRLHRFINTRRKAPGMVFGALVLYEAGRSREVVDVAEDQEELDVQQMAADQPDDERRREFLDATLYFGVSGNHVIVVQTMSLTGRELENHLRWLIGEQAGILEDGERLILEQGLTSEGEGLVRHAKALRLGAPVFSQVGQEEMPVDESGYPDAADRARQRYSMSPAIGRRVLQCLFDDQQLAQLDLDRYTEAQDLMVEVNVRRFGRSSNAEDDPGRQALAAITSTLRHQHPDDIEVEHKMGKMKGRQMVLTRSRSVVHWNGVPDFEDVFHAMQDWLDELLDAGVVA